MADFWEYDYVTRHTDRLDLLRALHAAPLDGDDLTADWLADLIGVNA